LGDSGLCAVVREGPTNSTLNVHCLISGTAINGLDYALVQNWIIFPPGTRTSLVRIVPFERGQTATGTVELSLVPSSTLPSPKYSVGSPSNALVCIQSRIATNRAPEVTRISPPNGAQFDSPIDLPVLAWARDQDGVVKTVEFFVGTETLGLGHALVLPSPPLPSGQTPPFLLSTNLFALVWSNDDSRFCRAVPIANPPR
jgi:hypothetical protein